MITERQIKSRFQKRHLRKLIQEMLKWKLCINDNTPLLQLRSGINEEMIVNSFGFSCIEHLDKGEFKYLIVRVAIDGKQTSHRLKIQDKDSKFPGWCSESSHKECDTEVVDHFITRCLRRDAWFKDNSAIGIII